MMDKCHSISAALNSHIRHVYGLTEVQDVSADLEPSRIKIYGQHISNFVEIFEKNLNLFDPTLEQNNLYNITTGEPVTAEVAEFY